MCAARPSAKSSVERVECSRRDRAMRPSPARRARSATRRRAASSDTMIGIEPGLERLGHHGLQRMDVRAATARPTMLQHARRAAGHRAQHAARRDVAARGAHAGHRAVAHVDPQHLGVLVDLHALAIRAARRSPRPRRRGARSRPARDTARPAMGACPPQSRSICGTWLLHERRRRPLRESHAEVLVDLGAPARGAQVAHRNAPA